MLESQRMGALFLNERFRAYHNSHRQAIRLQVLCKILLPTTLVRFSYTLYNEMVTESFFGNR
jgi:hypothetical protein